METSIIKTTALKKINLNIKNESGDTPLLHAIRINAQKTIIEAIARDPRCDKDEYDKDGFSALYLAVQKNNTELVEILKHENLLEGIAHKNLKIYLKILVKRMVIFDLYLCIKIF